MGRLTLPQGGGAVCVDANIVIYTVESCVPWFDALEPFWTETLAGRVAVSASELVVLETMVAPLRRGNRTMQNAYEEVFRGPIGLHPITLPVLREAARLRAGIPALRTPDAIHAATALATGCAMFLTNDPVFKRIPGLPVTVLSEAVAAL